VPIRSVLRACTGLGLGPRKRVASRAVAGGLAKSRGRRAREAFAIRSPACWRHTCNHAVFRAKLPAVPVEARRTVSDLVSELAVSQSAIDDARDMFVANAAMDPWRLGYAAAVLNATVFLIASGLASAMGPVSLATLANIDLAFLAGSLVSFGLMIRGGGQLAAISYFVLGSGLLFGFGTYYSAVLADETMYQHFSLDDQLRLLPKVDLVNAVAVTIVLLVAWPQCRNNANEGAVARSLDELSSVILRILPLLLVLCVPVVVLQFLTFPRLPNATLQSLLEHGGQAVSGVLLLAGMQWSKLGNPQRLFVLGLLTATSMLGFVGFSKEAALMPLAAMTAGMLLDLKSRRTLAVLLLGIVPFYFFFAAPLVGVARSNPLNRPENSFSQNLAILETSSQLGTSLLAASSRTDSPVLGGLQLFTRFGDAPLQAWLIEQYDTGDPGHSLDTAWTNAIPRLLWPNKPNNNPGVDLDNKFFNRGGISALAPTFCGEGYWNYGWIGVIAVSVLLGLEFGWYTRKWFRFGKEGLASAGILVTSPLIAFQSFWVESSVAGAYVGGFVMLFVLTIFADWALPNFIRAALQFRFGDTEQA